MNIEQEIDRLYQLPLSEFIAERNALSKRAGADAARVKPLEKPNAPAWAVNQLYWRERKLYDAVVKMSTRLRTAQSHALTGKKTDVPLAQSAHAAAVREAADRAEALLRQSGDAASDATLAAIRQTLDTLPVDEAANPPGRLTRPIEPAVGFGALGDMLKGAAIRPASTAEVVRFPPAAKKKSGADAEAQRAKEEAAAEERERAAKRREAEAALLTARRSLAEQEEDRRDFRARLEKSDAAIAKLRGEITRLERELK